MTDTYDGTTESSESSQGSAASRVTKDEAKVPKTVVRRTLDLVDPTSSSKSSTRSSSVKDVKNDGNSPNDAIYMKLMGRPTSKKPVETQPKQSVEPNPKRSAERQPNQSAECQPNQSVEHQPKQSVERQPKQSVDHQPKQSVEHQAKQSDGRQPKQSVDRQPKRSVDRQPKRSVEHQPKQSDECQPKQSVDRQPKRSAERQPKQSVEHQPKQSVERQPKQSIELQPKQSDERQPKQSVDRQPKQSVDRKPKQSAERQPKQSVELQPKQSVELQPKQSDELQPKQSVDRQPKQSVDRQPKQSAERQPKQSVDRQPKQSVDLQPKQSVERQPKQELYEQSDSVTDTQSEHSDTATVTDIQSEHIDTAGVTDCESDTSTISVEATQDMLIDAEPAKFNRPFGYLSKSPSSDIPVVWETDRETDDSAQNRRSKARQKQPTHSKSKASKVTPPRADKGKKSGGKPTPTGNDSMRKSPKPDSSDERPASQLSSKLSDWFGGAKDDTKDKGGSPEKSAPGIRRSVSLMERRNDFDRTGLLQRSNSTSVASPSSGKYSADPSRQRRSNEPPDSASSYDSRSSHVGRRYDDDDDYSSDYTYLNRRRQDSRHHDDYSESDYTSYTGYTGYSSGSYDSESSYTSRDSWRRPRPRFTVHSDTGSDTRSWDSVRRGNAKNPPDGPSKVADSDSIYDSEQSNIYASLGEVREDSIRSSNKDPSNVRFDSPVARYKGSRRGSSRDATGSDDMLSESDWEPRKRHDSYTSYSDTDYRSYEDRKYDPRRDEDKEYLRRDGDRRREDVSSDAECRSEDPTKFEGSYDSEQDTSFRSSSNGSSAQRGKKPDVPSKRSLSSFGSKGRLESDEISTEIDSVFSDPTKSPKESLRGVGSLGDRRANSSLRAPVLSDSDSNYGGGKTGERRRASPSAGNQSGTLSATETDASYDLPDSEPGKGSKDVRRSQVAMLSETSEAESVNELIYESPPRKGKMSSSPNGSSLHGKGKKGQSVGSLREQVMSTDDSDDEAKQRRATQGKATLPSASDSDSETVATRKSKVNPKRGVGLSADQIGDASKNDNKVSARRDAKPKRSESARDVSDKQNGVKPVTRRASDTPDAGKPLRREKTGDGDEYTLVNKVGRKPVVVVDSESDTSESSMVVRSDCDTETSVSDLDTKKSSSTSGSKSETTADIFARDSLPRRSKLANGSAGDAKKRVSGVVGKLPKQTKQTSEIETSVSDLDTKKSSSTSGSESETTADIFARDSLPRRSKLTNGSAGDAKKRVSGVVGKLPKQTKQTSETETSVSDLDTKKSSSTSGSESETTADIFARDSLPRRSKLTNGSAGDAKKRVSGVVGKLPKQTKQTSEGERRGSPAKVNKDSNKTTQHGGSNTTSGSTQTEPVLIAVLRRKDDKPNEKIVIKYDPAIQNSLFPPDPGWKRPKYFDKLFADEMQEIDDLYNAIFSMPEVEPGNYPREDASDGGGGCSNPVPYRLSAEFPQQHGVYSGELLPRFKMVTPPDQPLAITPVSPWVEERVTWIGRRRPGIGSIR